jgi:hypothetical protein
VPPGGQYPSRGELGAQLQPYIDDVKSLGANRGYDKYNQLNDIYTTDSEEFYNPVERYSTDEAVKLTDVPTSSTDYSRPRTVAAGYDPKSKTMTVVFRDGTFYNYYEVTPGEWTNFSSSFSKGKPWLNKGFTNGLQQSDGLFISKPRGPADASSIDPAVLSQLYRVARTQQLAKKPLESRFNPGKVAGWQAKLPPGTNPSRGGKPPSKRKP